MKRLHCWTYLGILNIIVAGIILAFSPSHALAKASPEKFYERYIGKSVDVDGYPLSQPYQCYDLWAQFVMDEYGTESPIVIGPSGCAEDIWYNFDGLGLDKFFKKVRGRPRDGDWVIYDWSENSSYSHVGMFREDNGDGTITILHQNYLGQPEVTQDRMTTNYIVGYIRPLIYSGDYEPLPSRGAESRDVPVSEESQDPDTETEPNPPDTKDDQVPVPAVRPVSVTVNGVPLTFDQPPIIANGRTMVPMRAIFEALETTVDWQVGKQTVTATKDETTIIITIGSSLAFVNGREHSLDVPPQLVNNRTLVPVRFISESLGAQVDWVISSQTVAINQKARD